MSTTVLLKIVDNRDFLDTETAAPAQQLTPGELVNMMVSAGVYLDLHLDPAFVEAHEVLLDAEAVPVDIAKDLVAAAESGNVSAAYMACRAFAADLRRRQIKLV